MIVREVLARSILSKFRIFDLPEPIPSPILPPGTPVQRLG
jgi:hypothetical protein